MNRRECIHIDIVGVNRSLIGFIIHKVLPSASTCPGLIFDIVADNAIGGPFPSSCTLHYVEADTTEAEQRRRCCSRFHSRGGAKATAPTHFGGDTTKTVM